MSTIYKKSEVASKVLIYSGIGYAAAVLTGFILPEVVSLLLPVAGATAGVLSARKHVSNLPDEVIPAVQEPVRTIPSQRTSSPFAGKGASNAPAAVGTGTVGHPAGGRHEVVIGPEFAPVVEYLSILEDMIISEGQKDTLDNEIVEKSLALFARLQRVIPLLQELNNGEINHTVRRLILKDLNGVINPFLRLGGEAKTKNRRMLLNGLKDVDSKISDIASTIEHKDLMELQSKAELIHQRYSSSEL
ncbi:hypothetical protein [Paenibacillus sp. sgz500958]|uniref:hypothetical protein n=1 Tax=Paenibacillus sp. sgz500958 TaxID=3242475 RepID=UPI0036D234F6